MKSPQQVMLEMLVDLKAGQSIERSVLRDMYWKLYGVGAGTGGQAASTKLTAHLKILEQKGVLRRADERVFVVKPVALRQILYGTEWYDDWEPTMAPTIVQG